jgi:hypothetical protein
LVGERHVSRFQVEQATRNSAVLHNLRSEIGTLTARADELGGDMVSVKAAQVMHGRALDVLMQDVRQLRQGQDEIKACLDRMEEKAATRHNELLAAVRAIVG